MGKVRLRMLNLHGSAITLVATEAEARLSVPAGEPVFHRGAVQVRTRTLVHALLPRSLGQTLRALRRRVVRLRVLTDTAVDAPELSSELAEVVTDIDRIGHGFGARTHNRHRRPRSRRRQAR